MATGYSTQQNGATTAELADELHKAHGIIQIALNCLEGEARVSFIEEVHAACLDGEGVTRANERQTLLERVESAPMRGRNARPLPQVAPPRHAQGGNQIAAQERAFDPQLMTMLHAFIRKELGASPIKPKLHVVKS